MNQHREATFDFAIVGGGLTGGATALVLAELMKDNNLTMALCERELLLSKNDKRVLALTYGGVAILTKLGLWQEMTGAHPVTSLEISLFDRKTIIRAADLGLAVLGYTITYGELQQFLFRRLHQLSKKNKGFALKSPCVVKTIEMTNPVGIISDETEKFYTNLIFSAQGSQSQLTKSMNINYHEQGNKKAAWVMRVDFDGGKMQRGYFISKNGFLLALVPYKNDWTAILTSDSNEIDESDCQKILYELGCACYIRGAVQRFSFTSYQAIERVKGPLILLGNAAYNMPPLGGQNYNLTLFTIYELHKAIAAHLNCGKSIKDRSFLQKFFNQSEKEITQRIVWVNRMNQILRRQPYSLAVTLVGQSNQVFRKLLGCSWVSL